MTTEANPNALDSKAIKYLGENNKKVVMKMFDEDNTIQFNFEMSVIDNDSNTDTKTNNQIDINNINTQ